MRVLIVGAGIAGLSSACHLAQAGHDVTVFERAAELSEAGAGIQLSANAVHSLHAIGLSDALADVGLTPEIWHMRLHDSGEVVASIELGERHEELHGRPYYVLHRAALQSTLIRRLEELQPDALRLGEDVERFEETWDGVALPLDAGTEHGDVLVIADGIRSRLRPWVAATGAPVYTGFAAWRTIVPASRLPDDLADGRTDLFMGPRSHCILYRVKDVTGETLLNFVAVVERPAPERESWTARRPWEEFRDDLAGWHGSVRDVVHAADRDAVYIWSLFDREALPVWRTDRAVLIGDAAHPTMPNMAQGAAMAIEDAAVLTRCLAAFPDVPDALERFETARLPRTTRIVNAAREILRAFHGESPDAIRAELLAGRSALRDRDDWLYNYDPMTAPLS